MQISEQGIALIRRFEGFSPLPYRCPAGVMTIGYGHAIRRGEVFEDAGISRDQAEYILKSDAERAGEAVTRYIDAELTQNQYDALASFVFNIGAGAFSRSTARKVINRGWHGEVPGQLARWVYVGGKRQPGLVARRQAEGELYGG